MPHSGRSGRWASGSPRTAWIPGPAPSNRKGCVFAAPRGLRRTGTGAIRRLNPDLRRGERRHWQIRQHCVRDFGMVDNPPRSMCLCCHIGTESPARPRLRAGRFRQDDPRRGRRRRASEPADSRSGARPTAWRAAASRPDSTRWTRSHRTLDALSRAAAGLRAPGPRGHSPSRGGRMCSHARARVTGGPTRHGQRQPGETTCGTVFPVVPADSPALSPKSRGVDRFPNGTRSAGPAALAGEAGKVVSPLPAIVARVHHQSRPLARPTLGTIA